MSKKKEAPKDVQGRPVLVEEGHAVVRPDYVNMLPWIERERMTWEQFKAHCAEKKLPEPTPQEWADTFIQTAPELAGLLALTETQIGDMSVLDKYFVVRALGNKPRVCWIEDGLLCPYSFGDFKNAHINDKVEVGYDDNGLPKSAPMTEIWLQHNKTPRYDYAKFMPGKYYGWDSNIYQLWPGWPEGLVRECDTKPRLVGDVPEEDDEFDGPGRPAAASRFLNHMYDSMCGGDEEVYWYLLGWMAEGLIRTGRSQVAVALNGPSGGGKGTFATLYGSFFGRHYVPLGKKRELTGNFNKLLMQAQLVLADEISFTGDDEDVEILRGLVTEPTINIEFKGVDIVPCDKEFRMILTSNKEHSLSVLKDDRRFLVLNVDSGKNNKNYEGYFKPMEDQWFDEGGQVALFRWLTGRYWQTRLEHVWRVGDRPVTQKLLEQKEASLNPVEKLIHHMLVQGEVPHRYLEEDDRVFASNTVMAKENRLEFADSTKLGQLLRKIAGREGVRRSIIPHGRVRGFFMDDLATSRERWEEHLGWKVDWPEEPATWLAVINDEKEAKQEAADKLERERKDFADRAAARSDAKAGEPGDCPDDEIPF